MLNARRDEKRAGMKRSRGRVPKPTVDATPSLPSFPRVGAQAPRRV